MTELESTIQAIDAAMKALAKGSIEEVKARLQYMGLWDDELGPVATVTLALAPLDLCSPASNYQWEIGIVGPIKPYAGYESQEGLITVPLVIAQLDDEWSERESQWDQDEVLRDAVLTSEVRA